MRGAPRLKPSFPTVIGIIPACAGSTHCSPCQYTSGRDHPRMCGEHNHPSLLVGFQPGSSPHVRGALEVVVVRRDQIGIIPACAGSTRKVGSGRCPNRDHPRMCGEHSAPNAVRMALLGSSPHVRGAHRIQGRGRNLAGIIPACAGSTIGSPRTLKRYGDHPRMCGEHEAAASASPRE